MKLFFAGTENTTTIHVLGKLQPANVLASFYYLPKLGDVEGLYSKLGYAPNVFIDSGGYTARIHGRNISVEDYGKFLLPHAMRKNFQYANLDLSKTEDTLRNQEYLEKMGLHPIPVFHYDEYASGNKDLLVRYAQTHDYIALGGAAGVRTGRHNLDTFLNYCFSIVRHPKKLHGFGITSTRLLEMFPWYSVDSTSWYSGVRYGQGKIPDKTQKEGVVKYRYNQRHKDIDHLYGSARSVESIVDVFSDTVSVQRNKRLEMSAMAYMHIEKYYTEFWEKRGVVWK